MSGDTFYITTAISYPNGRPHIGHAYEAIAADAIARFHRMQGKDVCLLTGTDEHGLKMVQTARAAGKETRALADEMSGLFREMCDKLNVDYQHFVRTTDPAHHEASIALWKAMEAKGDLYLDRYEGWYSVRDEAFYDEKELIDGEGGERLSPQSTPVEWTVEETWFFRLSKYQDQLLDLCENTEFIEPVSRRNEVVQFIRGGLKDLSVSRTSFDWGVKVPGSPGHVMYVWVDALMAYMSGIGFPDREAEWRKYWPADIHLIGKDIVRFHTVYWPAFLMSADLPLPKQVFGHGFLLARGGEKMSKSLGNVVDPIELAEKYGVDQLRYFFLREVTFGQDGTWSEEAIVTRCNAELANSFGNLAQRVLSFIAKNLNGRLPYSDKLDEPGDSGYALTAKVDVYTRTKIPEAFGRLAFSSGIDQWLECVFDCNKYIDEQAPWKLRKTDEDAMEHVLGNLFVCIWQLAIAVRPIIPSSVDDLLDQMGAKKEQRTYNAVAQLDWYHNLRSSGFRVSPPTPIFPRLELAEAA